MTVRSRFIKSVVATAKSDDTRMPWTRGDVRSKSIQRRTDAKDATQRTKTASA